MYPCASSFIIFGQVIAKVMRGVLSSNIMLKGALLFFGLLLMTTCISSLEFSVRASAVHGDKLKVLRLPDQKRENGGRKLTAGQLKNKNPETESHKVGGGSLDRSVLKLAIRRLQTLPSTPKYDTSYGASVIPRPPMNPYTRRCSAIFECRRTPP
ncbi:hypothetical protein Droror1_Dr00021085 [Drosera rotundifolia]